MILDARYWILDNKDVSFVYPVIIVTFVIFVNIVIIATFVSTVECANIVNPVLTVLVI
jgi:hypothetical protein